MFFQKYRDNLNFFDVTANPIDVLGLFKPENQEEEMEKWLASPKKSYNPQFVYDEAAIYEALIRAKKLRKALPRIARYYEGSPDWRAILTYDLLTEQIADLDATIALLDAFTTSDVIEHDCAEKATNRLFGEVSRDEYNIAVDLICDSATEIFKKKLIHDSERHLYDQSKLESIIHDYLFDFNGVVTDAENEILQNKTVDEEQTAKILEQVIKYMFEHSTGQSEIHIKLVTVERTDHFGIMPVALRPFSYDIAMPLFRKTPEGKLTASNILQVVAHEINTHLRVMISSEVLTERISPHFRPNLLNRSMRNLSQEGFATLNGDACLEETSGDVFEPLTIIVPDYVKQGHNFAETAKFIYDIYNLDPDMDHRPTHRIVWTILQSFFGCKDTSAHAGYSFPYHQVYPLGAIRILKELTRKDNNYFEDPLSLMRYSEFTLDMIRTINHIEHDLGQKLAPDPFEYWNFANFHPDAPNPTAYCKQLLLDL